ncbi:hypothetical protein TH53_24600 [Pedobacter lusitanus]|uniref:Uncharacterized protein n=1 Tax=Pedobacter lusitanus TaxID=1503925 RepID=A0A0D0FQL6_9SPHI|nr:hypothetical protein [Pedobacter lusitanus]KIO74749.1 hypothetical protein TH53_24600 [Pedobacter lusitanus]
MYNKEQISKQLIGKWKAVSDKYAFNDKKGNTIHPDQINTELDINISLDGKNMKCNENEIFPSKATYEIHSEGNEFYIIQSSVKETEVYAIKIDEGVMKWVTEPEGMQFNKDGKWLSSPNTIYTIEFIKMA